MELTLFVDHQCNLRCSYCYTGDKFGRRMSRETMHKAVALALEQPGAELDVAFFGGEPLMHEGFVRETVDHVEQTVAEMTGPKPRLRFSMNTNATLVDDEIIELMGAPRRWTAFVSLDGPPAIHDRARLNVAGKGSFEAAARGLERLRQARIPRALLAVITPESGPHLGDTMRAMLPFKPGRVAFSANYRAAWTEADLEQLRSGLEEAAAVWMGLFRAGIAIPVEPFHGKILSHLKGGTPCPSRCLLGGREMTVTPLGRIYPCAQMVGEDDDDTLVIGHVDGGLDRAAMGRLQALKDRVEVTCEGCELRARCQSQCGCRHVALSGELGRINATLCEIEAAYVDTADRVAEQLFEEQCSTFLQYYYGRQWRPASGAELRQLRRARNS